MKIKQISKKLNLSKETIADLNSKEMKEIKGGIYTGVTCQTNVNCTDPLACEYTYSRPIAACPTYGKLTC